MGWQRSPRACRADRRRHRAPAHHAQRGDLGRVLRRGDLRNDARGSRPHPVHPRPRAAVLGPAGLDWHRRNEREHEEFRNWIAAHSLDRIVAYDPVAFAEDIAATPLLMILADADTTSPPGVAGQVYDGAGEPKQLVELSAGHYDVYDNPAARQVCIEATIKFPARHLSATWQFFVSGALAWWRAGRSSA
jgi:hypothetical protein